MRKGYLLLFGLLAVAAAVWGPSLIQDKITKQVTVNKSPKVIPAIVNEQKPEPEVQEVPKEEPSQIPAPIKESIPAVNPQQKETIVEGTVEKVDSANRIVTFAQELDDNSKKIDPRVTVKKGALIMTPEGKVSLEAIKAGDYVTMVIDGNSEARAIEVN